MTELQGLLDRLVRLLDASGVPFMIAGSFASTAHGLPRTTQDLDVVIDPPGPEALDSLLRAMSPDDYYVDAEAARDALRRRSMFNVVDQVSGWKVDFILRKNREYSRFPAKPCDGWTELGIGSRTVLDVCKPLLSVDNPPRLPSKPRVAGSSPAGRAAASGGSCRGCDAEVARRRLSRGGRRERALFGGDGRARIRARDATEDARLFFVWRLSARAVLALALRALRRRGQPIGGEGWCGSREPWVGRNRDCRDRNKTPRAHSARLLPQTRLEAPTALTFARREAR